MNRSTMQRWVAVVSLLAATVSAASAASRTYGGTPTVPVFRGGVFVPQILYPPLRPSPVLVPTPLTVSGDSFGSSESGVHGSIAFVVHYSGGPASLDVGADARLVSGAPLIEQLDADDFRVTLNISDQLGVGSYKGAIRVRMCNESPCVNPLASAMHYFRWSVRWVNPGGWETFQRDARHDGYVPVSIIPTAIRSVWEWQRTNEGVMPGINSIASSGGRVFISDDTYFAPVASLYALDEATGSLLWRKDFSYAPAMNPPAVSGNRVYATTTGHEDTFLYSFDASNGNLQFQASFPAQWRNDIAPTIAAGVAYANGGYSGGGIYAYDALDGLPLWSVSAGGEMSTPAVVDGHAYYYDGMALKVYDAFSGTTLASIPDPDFVTDGKGMFGAPIVGSPDSVTSFSGAADSGRASSDVEQYESRQLVNFSIASQSVRWRTVDAYMTQPAVANGVVYAGRSDQKIFNAISEATGEVLWSWAPTGSDTGFHRNVVVTRNLAFVSTDKAVYAIDLVSHKPVWSWPTPGSISISGDGYLFIAEGATQSNGHLHAFKIY